MHNGASGSKRKASALEIAVPAKRSTDVVVPEEMLRTMASSLNAATLELMNLPSTDLAARGRVVAVMAKWERRLNIVLGIKRRGTSILAVSDLIVDAFQFLCRQDLDMLQIVSRRFNAIVEKKLTLVCLRMLLSAKISRSTARRQFVLIMDEVDAEEETRIPTGVDDETAATTLLLNACQSSRMESLRLYGTTPMSVDFFDSLALSAPTIFVEEFCIGKRTLADGVGDDELLRALQAFAELNTVKSEAEEDVNLQVRLVRTCFKAGIYLWSGGLVFGKKCETTIVENALLEFCFGACDEQYKERARYLSMELSTPLKSDFLQQWIEMAEAADCRHKLRLDISFWPERMPQDTAALDSYKQDGHTEWETCFGSVSGRHWTATYRDYGHGCNSITFKINH
ncbi:hypothetical protein AAVH_25230 [Aphelenchoides avenae]|nr:hypothetical protein AAVH_25230 [Aphelenchus avenae]